jgi:uncharacterized protein (TIRG00374 family)
VDEMKKNLAILISVGLVLVLLSQIEMQDIKDIFLIAKLEYIMLGFLTFTVAYVLRALRFYVLLEGKIGFNTLLKISCAHTFANTILPARTGEVSYVYLTKKYKVDTGTGIATLIIARFMDFIILSLFFVLSALMVEGLTPLFKGLMWAVAGSMSIAVITLIGLFYFKEKLVEVLKKILPTKINFIQYLLRKTEETVLSLEKLRSKKILLKSLVVSFLIWIFPIASVYFFFLSFGIELGLAEVALATCLASLLPLFPFYGAGGFGTVEAAYAAPLMIFGIEKGHAIVASFGVHILGLLYVSAIGIIALTRIK